MRTAGSSKNSSRAAGAVASARGCSSDRGCTWWRRRRELCGREWWSPQAAGNGACPIAVGVVSDFFQPPPSGPTEQAEGGDAPPWAGRPHGSPPGEVLSEVVLARSELATLSIAYRMPSRKGSSSRSQRAPAFTWGELSREGADHGPGSVFGGPWPMAGERSDVLPAELLRVGVHLARRPPGGNNIVGHDCPVDGPILWPLTGGAHGGGPETYLYQGYWLSPLPACGSGECRMPVADWRDPARPSRDRRRLDS